MTVNWGAAVLRRAASISAAAMTAADPEPAGDPAPAAPPAKADGRERQADPPVDRGPAGDTRPEWQRWIAVEAATRWSRYGPEQARALAEEAAICAWHLRRARRGDGTAAPIDPTRCAGCGAPLPEEAGAVELPDGARVHPFSDIEFDCLARYGERWRPAAAEALGLASRKRRRRQQQHGRPATRPTSDVR